MLLDRRNAHTHQSDSVAVPELQGRIALAIVGRVRQDLSQLPSIRIRQAQHVMAKPGGLEAVDGLGADAMMKDEVRAGGVVREGVAPERLDHLMVGVDLREVRTISIVSHRLGEVAGGIIAVGLGRADAERVALTAVG